MNAKIADAEALEAKQKALMTARAAANQLQEMRPRSPAANVTDLEHHPRVNLRLKPLRAFKGPNAMQDAYHCGCGCGKC